MPRRNPRCLKKITRQTVMTKKARSQLSTKTDQVTTQTTKLWAIQGNEHLSQSAPLVDPLKRKSESLKLNSTIFPRSSKRSRMTRPRSWGNGNNSLGSEQLESRNLNKISQNGNLLVVKPMRSLNTNSPKTNLLSFMVRQLKSTKPVRKLLPSCSRRTQDPTCQAETLVEETLVGSLQTTNPIPS